MKGLPWQGIAVPLEENGDNMGIVKAVHSATRHVCHRAFEWTDQDDMVQMAVPALSVYLVQVNFLWVHNGVIYVYGGTVWKKFTGCLSNVALRRIQSKLMAWEELFRTLGPRTPRRVDAIIDCIGRLRSQLVDVTDPGLENLCLAAATFGLVPHEAGEA